MLEQKGDLIISWFKPLCRCEEIWIQKDEIIDPRVPHEAGVPTKAFHRASQREWCSHDPRNDPPF